MAKKVEPEFPGALVVIREEDSDGSHYFLAQRDYDGIESGRHVAVYERKDVGTVQQSAPTFVPEGK